jgi:8-oxo-dGTP pyrophosphatase MutT (NUDIX family)
MVSAIELGSDASDGRRAWRARIQARLYRKPRELVLRPDMRPAAVLVPIVEREEPSVLLTRRTEHLPTHAGQISFPGGRFQASDESLTETALREFEEEIGIARDLVELAGYLDFHETVNSGFLILPVVGFVREDFTLEVDAHEVAEVFEVPLDFLLNPKNRARMHAERGGVMRDFDTIQFGAHAIWGATAAMIVNLSERLKD